MPHEQISQRVVSHTIVYHSLPYPRTNNDDDEDHGWGKWKEERPRIPEHFPRFRKLDLITKLHVLLQQTKYPRTLVRSFARWLAG